LNITDFYHTDGEPHDRYVVIGTSGSGKTTLAGRLADRVDYPHIELDALHWLPDWKMKPVDQFRADVRRALDRPTWVVDGNYSKVRQTVWSRAEAVIWLDLPFWTVFGRILKRTLIRGLTGKELWNGNRENLLESFLPPDGIVWWSVKTWFRRRREYPEIIARPEYAHLTVYRVFDDGETEVYSRPRGFGSTRRRAVSPRSNQERSGDV
jgi:adenylate kinase family enzyme